MAGPTADILKCACTHEEDCATGTENTIYEILKLEFPAGTIKNTPGAVTLTGVFAH